MHTDELLDVVTEADEVIRQEWRSVVYEKNLPFRVINAFIINSKKQLWIPRRTATKRLFPLALDCSVGGHVMAGESYEQALVRETQEELSLVLNPGDYKKLIKLTPHEHGTSSFMWVYCMYSNDVPNYNTDDFSDYYWLSADELLEKLSAGVFAKSDLLPIALAIKDLI